MTVWAVFCVPVKDAFHGVGRMAHLSENFPDDLTALKLRQVIGIRFIVRPDAAEADAFS